MILSSLSTRNYFVSHARQLSTQRDLLIARATTGVQQNSLRYRKSNFKTFV